MKEREPEKPFLVVYDNFKEVRWKTERELRELIDAQRVDFYKLQDTEEAVWLKEPGEYVIGSDPE